VTVRLVSASASACVFGLVLAAGPLGCDKTNNDTLDAGTSKEPAPAASPMAATKLPAPARTAELRPAVPTTTIEGVGSVPAWELDRTTKRCSTSAETRTKLDAIAKGSDAARAASLAAGTADVAALARDLGADDCFSTLRALANALLVAGRARFDAKKNDEANRYWRAALTVRPSLVIARYFLARGLSLAGKPEAAAGQVAELARAAQAGDANAVSSLESVRADKDFESVHGQASFEAAVASPDRGSSSLSGPLKRPETFASAVALLPEEFKKLQDDIGATPNRAIVTFKPAFTNVWLWHPDPSTELYVASVVDDPSKVGQPKADLTLDYGAIAVLRKDAAGKLTLLTVRKTGFAQPTVASGKNGSVIYSFEQMCGGLSGTLSWNGKSIDMNEKSCRDLP
jgi:hypothetical protein